MSAQKTAEQVLDTVRFQGMKIQDGFPRETVLEAMELYAKQCTSDLRGEVERLNRDENHAILDYQNTLQELVDRRQELQRLKTKLQEQRKLLDDMAGALKSSLAKYEELTEAVDDFTDGLYKYTWDKWPDEVNEKLQKMIDLIQGGEETKNK